MTKKSESLRGFRDLLVLFVLHQLGRPAKEREIEDITHFPRTEVSLSLSIGAKRKYIDHDKNESTWCINDVGRKHLFEVSLRENREYQAWEKGEKAKKAQQS